MTRRMHRYTVPVDDQPHGFDLAPLAMSPTVEATRLDDGRYAVAFWSEHDENASTMTRSFQVFGTGHPLPPGASFVGTAPRTAEGLVWHLYELADPA